MELKQLFLKNKNFENYITYNQIKIDDVLNIFKETFEKYSNNEITPEIVLNIFKDVLEQNDYKYNVSYSKCDTGYTPIHTYFFVLWNGDNQFREIKIYLLKLVECPCCDFNWHFGNSWENFLDNILNENIIELGEF